MSKVLIIIVAVIVVVAIVMVVRQFQGVKSESIGSLFRLSYKLPQGISGAQPSASISSGGQAAAPPAPASSSIPAAPAPTPPEGFTVSQLSPEYGRVKISGVSAASSWSSAQVTLSAAYGLKTPVDVTGWRVAYNKGDFVIPQAVADYNPSGFETLNDIILGTGGVLYVYGNQSPVGQGLRMNECVGFLNNSYTFKPSLPQNCASVYNRSEIATFSGACQSYILSLWGCAVPSANQFNSFSNEPACQAILNRFNYSYCYNTHRADASFFSDDWRAWLGSPIYLDPSHDRVLLFDKNGLLVDEYIY